MERILYIAQRGSAMILAPLVLVHLGLILYAVRGGLTGAEILGRTQGSMFWASFYGLFVLAAAVHAPIGVRHILREWTSISIRRIDIGMVLFGLLLLGMGSRAVVAVV